ncbi:hypothetical protein GCM10010377_29510 [Streptomyces viridiviolaceus]|nr:hypothetical protein GCM10010377_29510 [Streptomyces viridiviolaceus]
MPSPGADASWRASRGLRPRTPVGLDGLVLKRRTGWKTVLTGARTRAVGRLGSGADRRSVPGRRDGWEVEPTGIRTCAVGMLGDGADRRSVPGRRDG